MNKKIFLFIGLLSGFSFNSMANTVLNQTFNGFSVGGAATYNSSTFKLNYYFDQVDSGGQTYTDLNRNTSKSNTGFMPEIHLGYGYIASNRYYIGVNAFANIGSITRKAETIQYAYNSATTKAQFISTFKTKMENVYGLSIQPGYAVTNNDLVYANIGGMLSSFKSDVDAYYTETDTGTISDRITKAHNNTAYGFIAGAGYKHVFAKHLSLFAEINYLDFSKFKVKQDDTTTADPDRYEVYTVDPSNLQFKVGVSYHF